MSSYYWTAYLVIMGDYPNVSNLFSYMGWNVAFVFLLLLVLHMRCAESRRFFHPLMLLPIPLNAWQLTLYLQYGGVLNNILQVSATTATACFSLQSILWYRRNRKHGAARPNVAMVALMQSGYTFERLTGDYPSRQILIRRTDLKEKNDKQ